MTPRPEDRVPTAVISFRSGSTLTVPGPIDGVVEAVRGAPGAWAGFCEVTGFDGQRCFVRREDVEAVTEGPTPATL